jgi:hypothetical protein
LIERCQLRHDAAGCNDLCASARERGGIGEEKERKDGRAAHASILPNIGFTGEPGAAGQRSRRRWSVNRPIAA